MAEVRAVKQKCLLFFYLETDCPEVMLVFYCLLKWIQHSTGEKAKNVSRNVFTDVVVGRRIGYLIDIDLIYYLGILSTTYSKFESLVKKKL